MVSILQTGGEWQPRFAPQALQPQPETETFNLSPDSTEAPQQEFSAFGADGFTLLDAVDIINPLQHIPLVGNLYRDLTGDTLDPFSRVAGSTLFFGPLGAAVSTANVAMEEFTGKDIGGHMIAFLKDTPPAKSETEIADAAAQAQTGQTPAKPSAAGTDSLDPVTAWAMNEINHRNAEAVRLGMAPPVRSYSSQLALANSANETSGASGASGSATPEITAVVPPSQWSEPLPDDLLALAAEPVATPEPAATPPAAPAAAVPPSDFIPVNAFQAEHRASPQTLLRLKQSTAAYKTVDFPTGDGRTDTPAPKPAAAPAAARPSAPASASVPTPEPAAQAAAAATPVPANSSWFTSSMLDALGKYKALEPTAAAQAGSLTAPSNLH